MQLTKKIIRNAASLNPKKNPAMRRRFHQTSVPPSVRVACVDAPRPRLRGALSKREPFDMTAFQKAAHEANQTPDNVVRGAFGGTTKRARFLKALKRAAKSASEPVKQAA